MPTSPQIVQCDNCDALKKAYDKVECTILELMRNKLSNISYNVSLYYDQALVNKLVRYKRVITNRLYNPKYPCSQISTQDLVTLAVTTAYMGPDCSSCPKCFPPIPTTTTTTSTTSTSTTTSTTSTTTSTSTTSSSTTTSTTTLPAPTTTTTTSTTTTTTTTI
jgi:hypothetical protein